MLRRRNIYDAVSAAWLLREVDETTRLGPRLRISSKRMRSSNSTGAYMPFGIKTSGSACGHRARA